MRRWTALPSRLNASWCALLLAAVVAVLSGCATEVTKRPSDAADLPVSAEQPPNAATLHAMARILATQGRDSECERLLNQIIQQEPDYLPAYCDLAELDMRRNRPEDAAKALQAGLARAPNDPVLLNNLGMCRLLSGQFEIALELFTKAVAAAPRNDSYLANKAMALGMLQRDDEAAAIYRQILPSAEEVGHNMAVLRNARSRWRRSHSTTAPSTAPTGLR